MPQFRAKTQVFEAVQMNLKDREATRELLEAMGATPGKFDMPLVDGKSCWWRQSADGEFSLIIYGSGSEYEAKHGDWVVKGRNGTYYVENDEAFIHKFEPA